MNNFNSRLNPAQTVQQSSLKYPLPSKDIAKEMAKTKCVSNAGSVSALTVGKVRGSPAGKGSSHTTKTDKRETGAKSAATKPRRRKRQFASNGSQSTRQLRRNERERGRKARLNAAFQVLRSVVPNTTPQAGTTERKMTQVEILRLAKNYISNLTEILQTSSESCSFNSYRCV